MGFFDDATNLLYTNPVTAPWKGLYDLGVIGPGGPGQNPASIEPTLARERGIGYKDIPSIDNALSTTTDDLTRRALLQLRGEMGQAAEKRAADDSKNSELNATLDKLFGTAQESGIKSIDQNYGVLRKQLAENQAAAGRFDSPVAAIPELNLATQEGGDISSLIGNLAMGRVSPQVSLYGQQKGFNYQDAKDALDRQTALQLGQIQGDALKKSKQPGSLDYLNTGILGLSALSGFL